MQKMVTLFFVITTAVFGTLYFIQGHDAKDERTRVVVLEKEVQDKGTKIQERESAVRNLTEEKATLAKESGDLKEQVARMETRVHELESGLQSDEAQAKDAEAPPTLLEESASLVEQPENAENKESSVPEGFGKFINKMLKDPDIKNVIREQHKTQLGMMYGDLFKELKLSQEESETFKDMMLENQTKGVETAVSLMGGGMDEAKMAELTETLKKGQESFDAKIKEFLGGERFATYEEYNKTIPDRMVTNQFKQQLLVTNAMLDKYQETQLIKAMREERENFKFTGNFGDPGGTNYAWPRVSGEELESYFREKEQCDSRIFERAQLILTAEQIAQFKIFQEQQLQAQRTGMKMAAEMFGRKNEGNGAAE